MSIQIVYSSATSRFLRIKWFNLGSKALVCAQEISDEDLNQDELRIPRERKHKV